MAKAEFDSLRSLIIFKTVYETGSASQAARTLGITQSGVSRSLALLEEGFELQLFLRRKNRILPTPEAAELYVEILRLLGNVEELRHSVVALREFGASRLRIVAIPGLAFGFVPRLIAALLKENAGFTVSFDVMSSHDVMLELEAAHADIGFVTLPVRPGSLHIEPWLDTEAVCLLPAGHRLVDRQAVHVTDLTGEHLVISNQPDVSADPLLKLVERENILIRGKTESNLGAMTALVAQGVGVGVINPITAHDQLDGHGAVVARSFSPALEFSFGLVCREEWVQTTALSLLRKFGEDIIRFYEPLGRLDGNK